MTLISLAGRAHELLVTALTNHFDEQQVAIWKHLPESGFQQPGRIIVCSRPEQTSRTNFANDAVTIELSCEFWFLATFRPHDDGRLQGLEDAELLRERAIVALESLPGCGLFEAGALSWMHSWTFPSEPQIFGNNLAAVAATMMVPLDRPRGWVGFTTPEPEPEPESEP